MANKKAYPLRVDPEVHAAIERWAAEELRSVNVQIEFLLRKVLRDSGRLEQVSVRGVRINAIRALRPSCGDRIDGGESGLAQIRSRA